MRDMPPVRARPAVEGRQRIVARGPGLVKQPTMEDEGGQIA